MTTALSRAFPDADRLPHTDLADLPTSVDRAPDLADELGVGGLSVKRDDQTAALYGGNKIRKLEWLFGDAFDDDHSRVRTVGAIGSHHVLATCLFAREVGLEPGALQFPQPVTDHVLENLRALSTTRPELTLVDHKAKLPFEMLKEKIDRWLERGPRVYYIPGGGSSPTGAVGYVNAALEYAEQVDQGDAPEPDVIFVAAGTCGTFAGLLAGFRLADISPHVVGVRVVDRVVANPMLIARLANRTAAHLTDYGFPEIDTFGGEDIDLLDDYFGEGYGEPTVSGLHAIDVAERTEGLHLDPTYTGKTVAAIHGERHVRELDDKHVLYWNTLSSADLSDRIDRASPLDDLPADYHHFFDQQSA
jgi:D-cysteine desulfhydrase